MTDVQTLTILLGQNERQRDTAIAEHQRAIGAAEAAQGQAEQLRMYRREYEQRWRLQFCREGKIELVHCYQSFVERLTLAIEQQSRVAEHAVQLAELERAFQRRVAEQRLATDRRDQKQTDEAASRAAWNRLASTRPAPLM